MKIQCDVCEKDAASVFCAADEAVLCQNCDNRVHNANKLASKHLRISLLNPQFKDTLSCDICQERQALLFCKEDRALLCRECDTPLHKANEHTKKHNRFILSGVKLSADASSIQDEVKVSVSNEVNNWQNTESNCSGSSSNPLRDNESSQPQHSNSTNNISDYFLKTLPGWHVEDLLDSSSYDGSGKVCTNE